MEHASYFNCDVQDMLTQERTLTYIEETAKGLQPLSIDSRHLTDRKIFLTGSITDQTAVNFAKIMLYLSRSDKPICIYINSPGGETQAGLMIYDLIQGCQCKINMYCIGQAASMAAIILASGQKGRRFILPHSRVMIHEVFIQGQLKGSAASVARISQSLAETKETIHTILARHTGKSLEEISRASCFDNYMNAEEAVRFGICDKIVETISGGASHA